MTCLSNFATNAAIFKIYWEKLGFTKHFRYDIVSLIIPKQSLKTISNRTIIDFGSWLATRGPRDDNGAGYGGYASLTPYTSPFLSLLLAPYPPNLRQEWGRVIPAVGAIFIPYHLSIKI